MALNITAIALDMETRHLAVAVSSETNNQRLLTTTGVISAAKKGKHSTFVARGV